MSYLPSRFVPYNQKEIAIRRLTLGEVDFTFDHQNKITDIVKYYADREVITGINVYDLTVNDWQFVELSLVALTFPEVKFELNGGKCPSCGDEVKTIELGRTPDGTPQIITISADLKSFVVPQEISFVTLDEEVVPPIELELSIGVVKMDFLRIRHYFELAKETGKPQSEWTNRQLTQKQCGVIVEDLEYNDGDIIDYAQEKMYHGVNGSFKAKCQLCKTEYPVTTSWEVASFIPFRKDKRLARDRVRFGNASTSERGEPSKTRVSSRPQPVQQSS